MVPWSELGDDARLRLLGAALEQTRASACITDADLDAPGPRILYVNPAYCAMTGRSRDDVIGRSPRIMQGPLTDRAELDRLRLDLAAGRPFSGETVNYRADGTPFEISWRIDPIVDASGRVTNYVATQQDVTALRRAERLLAAERLVDQALTDTLRSPSATPADVSGVAEAIVEAIGVVVPYGSPGIDLTVPTADGTIRIRRGLPVARGSAPDDGLGDVDDRNGTVAIAARLAFEHERFDGVISVSGLRRWELDAVDRDGLHTLAFRVPLVLDAALEYERRRAAALELQRALLPTIPALPGLGVATRYEPVSFGADVGGDFYDVIDGADRVFVVVGDVAGSGLRIAADMGRLALVLRGELRRHGDPALALVAADELCVAEGLFATAAIVSVDAAGGRAAIRSAGHPPPIVRRPGEVTAAAQQVGPPLGAGTGGWAASEVVLGPGAALALYTDGLVERRELDLIDGIDLLSRALTRAPEGLEAACDFVMAELTEQHPLVDDAALVLLAAE
ncbi:MAG: SpoIIE family protein phosphatase [Actinomycetota bacterium]